MCADKYSFKTTDCLLSLYQYTQCIGIHRIHGIAQKVIDECPILIERSCPFSTTALVPTQSIYDTTYTYDFYDAGTYLDCSVGCYFGVVGASEPIWWSATTQVTIPNL